MLSFHELLNKIPASLYDRNEQGELVKLFKIYADVFDDLKRVVHQLETLRIIDQQSGEVLDQIGKIVKEPRRELKDVEYRNYLKVAILRNISNGSLPTLSELMSVIVGKNNYSLRDMQKLSKSSFDGSRYFDGKKLLNSGDGEPAAFEVSVPVSTNINYLKDLISQAKTAGVLAKVQNTIM